MKRIMARISFELEVTDKEYKEFKAKAKEHGTTIEDELCARFANHGDLGYDSYIPEEQFDFE